MGRASKAPHPPQSPTSVSGFFVGAMIPRDAVGRVLEQVFLSGGSVQDLGGIFGTIPIPPNSHPSLQTFSPHVAALPSPKKAKPLKGPPKPGAGDATLAILRAAKGKPVKRQDISLKLREQGFSGTGVGSILASFVSRGVATRIEDGVFTLGPNHGAEKVRKQRASRGGGKTHTAIILDALRNAHPQTLTNTALGLISEKNQKRPDSIGVIINSALKRKQIKRVAPATYLWTGKMERPDASGSTS